MGACGRGSACSACVGVARGSVCVRVVRWRVAAHSLSSLPGHAESPVATRGCELSPVVASPVVASPVVASARPSLKPRASKATSGVKVGGGAALSCGEMVDWWSTTWLGLGLGLG